MSEQKDNLTQGSRLATLRRTKGLTAEQLAQAMTAAGTKVSRGAISNWERGTNGIVSSKLPALAKILGCSEGYLLRGDLLDDPEDSRSTALDLSNTYPTHTLIASDSSSNPIEKSQQIAMDNPSMKQIKKSNK